MSGTNGSGFSDMQALLFGTAPAAPINPSTKPENDGHRARLRNRFLADHGKAMPDYELLELFLMQVIQRRDVKPIAKALLAKFGDLFSVVSAPLTQLQTVQGVGAPTAIHLKTIEAIVQRAAHARMVNRDLISSWDAVVAYCRLEMAHRKSEHFRVLFLDRKNRLIKDHFFGGGTVDHVPVYTREVVKTALDLSASSLILVHNHPSGDPTPSPQDIDLTRNIERACQTVSITVHDHIIVGIEGETSLRACGYMTET